MPEIKSSISILTTEDGIQRGVLERTTGSLTSSDIKQVLLHPSLNELIIKGIIHEVIDFSVLNVCKNLSRLSITEVSKENDDEKGHLDKTDIMDIDLTDITDVCLDVLELSSARSTVRFALPECDFKKLSMNQFVALTLLNMELIARRKTPLALEIGGCGGGKYNAVLKNDASFLDELHIQSSWVWRSSDESFKVWIPTDLTRYSGISCVEELTLRNHVFPWGTCLLWDDTVHMPAALPGLRRLILEDYIQFPERTSVVIPDNYFYPALEEVIIWKGSEIEEIRESSLVQDLNLYETDYSNRLKRQLEERLKTEEVNIDDEDYIAWEKSRWYMYFKPPSKTNAEK